MLNKIFNLAIVFSLLLSLSGELVARRYKRIRDFLPEVCANDPGAPGEATYLTIGSELMASEAGKGGFVPLFIFATIPGGAIDTAYNDTVDFIWYEGIDNGSAKIYPGFIPDTTNSQTSVELVEGEAIVWVQDNEEEELIFIGSPRDTLKPSIPCVVTITPSGDSVTKLLIQGNGEINAGGDIPFRYLIKAVDDSSLIVPSYSGFIDPTKRTIISVSESNPNASAYLIDFLWNTSGQSISTYLISGMANVYLFDTEPETLTLVATTLLGDLEPDTFFVEVLPPEETINLLVLSFSGSFGTVSVEKNILALAFNFYTDTPDPSNNSSEVELRINDMIGSASASIFPSVPKTMTSGIAQFKMLDTEPDGGVIVEALTSGIPKLYPFFVNKTVYGFKPPGEAIMAKVSSPTTCVVSDTITLTIFAVDGLDSLDTSYSGWVEISIEEETPNGSAELLEYPTREPQEIVLIRNGTGRIWLSDNEVEDVRVTLNDAEQNFPFGSYLGNQTPEEVVIIHFEPAGGLATKWTLELPARATQGVTQTGTIKAVDDSGYIDTAFADTAMLSCTGNAILSDSSLPMINGVATFTIVDDSTEEVIVAVQGGSLTPREDTITFALRGAAAYLVPIAAHEFLVNGELQVAILAMSPEFEFDETWNGVTRLWVTDPGATSVSVVSGNLDSIPIVDGAGQITITDSEVELLELGVEWVSGNPPLESYPPEEVESEVKLIVTLPDSASIGGLQDTVSFETRDRADSLFPYTTWVEINWQESNPNGSVSFDGPTDSIPIINGIGFIGIEDTEAETVDIWVYANDPFIAEREAFSGEIHFFSIGIEEMEVNTAIAHHLSNCRPNPFMKSTHIAYTIGGREMIPVRLRIYDAAGRLVKTLVNQQISPGFYRLFWDGKDDSDRRVASGIYFFRLELPQKTLARKAILLR